MTKLCAWMCKADRCPKSLIFVTGLGASLSYSSPPAGANCQHDASHFRCVKVLSNYDGDTITVDIPGVHPLLGKKISVRVFGIDTPEVRGKGACEKEAARTAKKLVTATLRNARQVDLSNVQRDKYFRVLADVIVDGRSLSAILIKNNLAYEYHGGTKQKMNWCDTSRKPASKTRKIY